MKKIDRMAKALERLGVQADVADYFRAEGIKGIPGDIKQCPVANYLNRELKEPCYVYNRAGFVDKDHLGWVDVPTSVYRFIERFDRDLYPELVEE